MAENTKNRLKVVFMGAPDFAAFCLRELVTAGIDVVSVYTQPPRPAGRGKKTRSTPVAQCAEALGLPVCHPPHFKDPETIAQFSALKADIAVVVAYGLLLPKAVLQAPRLGCINLHASLLPRWRGAAPIQRAIMAGDTQSGVCVMRMTQGLDEGPVILQAKTAVTPEDTAQVLHDRLAQLGAPLLHQALMQLANGTATETAQPETGVLYAAKISKAEACIDWTASAREIDHHIRGLSPFPGAWSLLDLGSGPERIKILHSCLEETTPEIADPLPGCIVDDGLLVCAGDGRFVRLLTVQRAGRAVQDTDSFLRGHPVTAGKYFTSQLEKPVDNSEDKKADSISKVLL